MATVVAVLNSKGGSGKTTLAVHLARALDRRGLGVLIVDTDPQGTARDWHAAGGEATDQPGVVGVESAAVLTRELPRIAGGYDVAVIDGSAKVEGMTGAAVRAADVVLIPVRPSPADLWAARDLVDVIQTRQSVTGGAPAAVFVVSQQVVGTNLAGEIEEALRSYGLPVLAGRTSQRIAYAEAFISGATALDVEPGGKAAAEVEAITDELEALLKNE